ncbi:MAPEG family protein [Pseudomonas sp. 5P_3.1_Bac2]|uniref:MAPEG family protein n=1 Tax=Pseudomonas sp. 5P_3.1_Bac2 TaxID=2971617 RepID=UPI0021C6A4D8|nr:MAPEG family protein [Pseudomonas sp. 5P_3.1_Bac2]MCU1718430.1 MAPEG family protein [Pseudomonas sp. 5P_3.1_Bac2]
MTLAYWCVLIAIILPYVASITAKAVGGGFSPKYNHDPRAKLDTLTGMARRAHNAQLNGFEITPAFAAAVIIAHQIGVAGQAVIDQIAVAFIVSRVVYLLCYLLDWASLRSLVWIVGVGLIVSLFVLSA